MIVLHTILEIQNKFYMEKSKNFKERSHAEYGATWNRFLPKSLTNFQSLPCFKC